uniref:Expansin-like CBD domain-containing protein n=1 Tax=Physcomitrium patens TaxID=3218 RepID=A0A2K1KD43_PHYPA|nr:hypothetical protein PHYPA_010890 [Physcomitrium patens]
MNGLKPLRHVQPGLRSKRRSHQQHGRDWKGGGPKEHRVGRRDVHEGAVRASEPEHGILRGRQNMAFHVDEGSTAFWLEFVVKFHGGPGDIESVEVLHSGRSWFQPAKLNWGANRMLINTSVKAFKGPYDIKVVSKLNGQGHPGVLRARQAVREPRAARVPECGAF